MFHVHVRRICILLVTNEMFYNCLSCIWNNIWFKFYFFPCVFCLDNLFIAESRELKSPTLTSLLFVGSDRFYLFDVLRCSDIGCVSIYDCYVFIMNWPLYHYIINNLCLWLPFFPLRVYFVWYKYSYPFPFDFHLHEVPLCIHSLWTYVCP